MDILHLAQFKNAYRYTSDSLLLINFALNLGVKGELLDVGAGCGVIGMMLGKFTPKLHLTLLDIQKENVDLMAQNLQQNNMHAQIFHSDFKIFNTKKKYDYIVCNPPFYRNGAYESRNLHKNISKFQKHLPLNDFIAKANSLLKPKGTLYFCYEASALDKICFALENKKLKLTTICFVHTHKEKRARLVLIKAQKSVKSLCEVLPPFFMYENRNLSKEMQEIHFRFKIESYDF